MRRIFDVRKIVRLKLVATHKCFQRHCV